MSKPLPVGKVLFGAFVVPWWNRAVFGRALAVPLGSIALLMLSWYYGKAYVSDVASWLLLAVYGVLFTLFAVACHRLVLLGSEFSTTRFVPRWSWRESRFFAWWIAVYLIHVPSGMSACSRR